MKNNFKNKNNNNITSEKNNKNKDNTTSKNSNEEKLLKELNELLPEELNMSEKNKKLYKELLEKQSAKNPVKTFFRILSYIRYNMKSYILGCQRITSWVCLIIFFNSFISIKYSDKH